MADQEIHAKQGEPVKMNVLALPHDHSLPGDGDTKEPCASDNAGPLSLKTSVIGGANPAGATDDDGNPDTSAKGHYNCCVKGREKPDLANGGRLEDVLDTTEDGLFVKGRQKPTGADTVDSGAKFKTFPEMITSCGSNACMGYTDRNTTAKNIRIFVINASF